MHFPLSLQIQRYNSLLETIQSSLVYLENGIKGLVVMSADLEEIFNCIHNAQVPPLWGKVTLSLALSSKNNGHSVFPEDLSLSETSGFLDERFGSSCGADIQLGHHHSPTCPLLAVRVHLPHGIPDSGHADSCKEEQCMH